MARLAIHAALAAAAALGACAAPDRVATTNDPNASRTAIGPVTGQPVLYVQGAPVAGGQQLVPASATFKPGSGTIESIALVHIVPASAGPLVPLAPSPSAGATSVPGERALAYRLTIKMDDGSYQAVDQTSRNFLVGDRVALAGNGQVTKQ